MIADDLDQSQLFTLVLQRAGHRVTAVATGEKALAILNTTPFDLVITDYMLPDINGDEIIRRIHESGSKIPIILMSNHVDVYYLARNAHADGCYPKNDIFALVKLVASLLPTIPTNGSPMTASA